MHASGMWFKIRFKIVSMYNCILYMHVYKNSIKQVLKRISLKFIKINSAKSEAIDI